MRIECEQTAPIAVGMRNIRCNHCRVAKHDDLAAECSSRGALFDSIVSNHIGTVTKPTRLLESNFSMLLSLTDPLSEGDGFKYRSCLRAVSKGRCSQSGVGDRQDVCLEFDRESHSTCMELRCHGTWMHARPLTAEFDVAAASRN